MSPEWFSKDGQGTIFLEGIPGVGYVVALAQAIDGNTVSSILSILIHFYSRNIFQEQAKRAAIRSTDSLITTAAAVGGGLVAGPAGAIFGAAAGKTIGIGFEKVAADVVDPKARKGVGEQTLVSGIIEVATNAAGGGAGGVARVIYQETAGVTGSVVSKAVGSSATSATLLSGDA
jgi:hypothetical protein